ncbi:hypothetical protein PPERSA_01486 [Pseudocohnilembus persalinus]|uniref:Uncharacterized protein n=1 Tax=Pseudocohnilembus persalinus TaxID=266149 RepID=A0A0V0QH88_PSEPJ|nr:hypothetical protein PPERSA_01486 [Pseudocohnilembus persalinus]|eukprot:KRX01583.1 hypothetical protein PPERSA_01486 [Pseudocohnilembus persalinus]
MENIHIPKYIQDITILMTYLKEEVKGDLHPDTVHENLLITSRNESLISEIDTFTEKIQLEHPSLIHLKQHFIFKRDPNEPNNHILIIRQERGNPNGISVSAFYKHLESVNYTQVDYVKKMQKSKELDENGQKVIWFNMKSGFDNSKFYSLIRKLKKDTLQMALHQVLSDYKALDDEDKLIVLSKLQNEYTAKIA